MIIPNYDYILQTIFTIVLYLIIITIDYIIMVILSILRILRVYLQFTIVITMNNIRQGTNNLHFNTKNESADKVS